MATLVDTGLGASERVVAKAKATQWVLIWPLIWTAVSGGLLLWLTVPWLIFAIVFRRRTELLVTEGRLVHRTGLVSSKVATFDLAAFESIRAEQTLLGRRFDYGAIGALRSDLSEKRFGSLGGLTALKRAIEAELGGRVPEAEAA
jgi:uncharacterized membrane protein YdbT with pleckstrin-like domain